MKYLLIIFLISSCASNSSKVDELEDKINKLTTLLEKKEKDLDKKDNPKDKKEDSKPKIEAPDLNIKLPASSANKASGKTQQIKLGEKDNIDFILFFNETTYWIVLSPKNKTADINGKVVMNITHSNKSPESLSFFPIRQGIYKSFGDTLKDDVELEILFYRKNKKTIIFKVEANL